MAILRIANGHAYPALAHAIFLDIGLLHALEADADVAREDLGVVIGAARIDAQVLERDVGIRFKGVEKTNVEEYCVSEGWIRVAAGKAKDRAGNPMTIKLRGRVEPYFRQDA